MKNLIWVSMALVMITLTASPVFAQMSSSKGSAAISTATLLEERVQTNSWDEVLSTYIKIPQDKELVFDVALECGLYTDTLVRSKGGARDDATAIADIRVHVAIQPILGVDEGGDYILGPKEYAYPGDAESGVTFCRREQQLMAKFQGIFQTCEEFGSVADPVTGELRDECISYGSDTCLYTEAVYADDGITIIDYAVKLDTECLDYEELQLMQRTLSANASNFVSPNMDQGEYKVSVEAEITSSTDSTNGSAAAKGLIGLGSMVVDEVRFIKGDDGGNKVPPPE